MILEFKVNEASVQAAWLITLYELVEELNCKCDTYLEETYNRSYRNYSRTRIVEVFGSDTMLSWLKLRMERYDHIIGTLNNKPEVKVISSDLTNT